MNGFLKLIVCLLNMFFDQVGTWSPGMVVTGVSDIDAAIPEFWAEGVFKDASRESFWGALSGKEGSMMPVISKTGPLKEKGDQVSFTVVQQMMAAGVTGANTLKGREEKMGVGTFTVGSDIVRHATGVRRRANKRANYDQVKLAGQLLKDWFARKFDADKFNLIIDDANVRTLYANNAANEAALSATNGDFFGVSEIEMLRLALIRIGALPLRVKKVNGRPVPIYGIVFGEMEEYRLSQNTTFNTAIREAFKRFRGDDDHPLFNGAIGMYRNMILYPYYSILPIPQGTPLRPETTVYATLTTTATILSVGGATETAAANTPDYTAYFGSTGTIKIGSENITYTGKTVNTFTGLTRGANSTSAAQHLPDALITQRDVSNVIGFGAEAIFEAMPEEAEPIGDDEDYKEQIGLGIRANYGNALKKDKRLGKPCGAVLMKVMSPNPGTV